ncbi:pyridoxal-phosphate dependent enzyme [soil metagenome]
MASASSAFGEVETPLTSLDIDGTPVQAKLDFLTPTGSFKDRGFAVLISALEHAGATQVVEDSSGNAAASIAAYAARASIPCTVFAPETASPGKLAQATAYGATVVRVNGARSDVAGAAEDQHHHERGVVYASHNWHPFFIAGVATWALEVWEQLGFQEPDNVIVPAGSGSLVLGAHYAFTLLQNSGEIGRLPRIFAAQPEACAPIANAVEQHATGVTECHCRPTIAEGASIAAPVRGDEVVAALRDSGGGAVNLTEREIIAATLDSARQGLYIEPTSALAAAGARKLLRSGVIARSESSVLVLTGSGLKATESVSSFLSIHA